MIERVLFGCSSPPDGKTRKALYRVKLDASTEYDEEEHAHRVAQGLKLKERLRLRWRYMTLRRRAGQHSRPGGLLSVRRA